MSKSLAQALMAMHSEFGVVLEKDKKGNRGTYTSLASTLAQIHAMTSKHGLILTRETDIHNGKQILITILEHAESGDQKTCRSELTPSSANPSPDQAYGSSMTYHARYDAMAICGLFQDDDPSDHDGWKDHEHRKITDSEAKRLYAILKERGSEDVIKELRDKYGKFQNMTLKEYKDIFEREELE